jgi:hypothetical protein
MPTRIPENRVHCNPVLDAGNGSLLCFVLVSKPADGFLARKKESYAINACNIKLIGAPNGERGEKG